MPVLPGGRARYAGLDLFRPLSIFGVVLIHFPRVLDLGADPAFRVMMRLRDCALPTIILTSFFVITRSLLAHPERTFSHFASNRFMRLAVPCAIWSGLYWLLWEVAGPLWRGQPALWPPLSLLLSGYAHLWFLQFLFLGSVIAYPAVRAVAHARLDRSSAAGMWAAACVAVALAYWAWGRPFLTAHMAFALGEQADLHLRVAATQSIAYAKYVPLGVAVALAAGTIERLYRRPAFRVGIVLVAAAACLVHIAALAPAVSRLCYSMAVFIALLRPWPAGVLDWLRPVARLSYPIYVIHPVVAKVVITTFNRWLASPSIPGLVAGSLAVFALSAGTAVLLRTLVPLEWFLPTVAVEKGRAAAGMRHGRE
jgi:surface polysaccharide O-acyltransferase-like enzyme